MRKCRNWQTSKIQVLVSVTLVRVQVPSSAWNYMLRIRFQREGDSVLQYRVRIKREIGGIVYDTAAFIIYYTTKAKKIKDWYRFELPQSYPPNSQSSGLPIHNFQKMTKI